jgi:hypothetical protein
MCGALALLVVGVPVAGAAEVEQHPVRSAAPDAKRVREYLVRVHDPLPAEIGEHPAACDWLSYLRWRHADGPRRSADADTVISLMPGFLSGAAPFDQVARNTIRNAAARGKHVEVWAMERRSNCLEDNTGVREAIKAGDPTLGWDYYWGNATVNGKRFSGFASAADAAWLEGMGLDQTMRDWNAVNRAGLPGRRLRAKKLVCGGHSLGGPLTASYAGWDFDGDPATTRDAGYRQCAGFVGFDTRLRVASPGGGGLDPLGLLLSLGDLAGSPYISVPPLTPETFQVPPLFGLAAWLDPEGTDALTELPRTLILDLAQRFLFSRDAVNFATAIPSIRDFTVTNEVALAGIFDDNSAPLTFLRASVGSVSGGPVVDKNFPFPDSSLALPGEPSTPLYTWETYGEIDDAAVPLNSEGVPFTSRESEVTSLRQLARTQFEAPAGFIEQYFPVRILTDVDEAGAGDRSATLANLVHDGISRRPALLIQAADSDSNDAPDAGRPYLGEAPNDVRGSHEVILPGYNHIDVTTAARRQNDGRPEPSSAALTRFALRVVGR